MHCWLIQHRDSGVRAALGAALLAAVWLLWPGPGYDGGPHHSARGADQQAVADDALRDGLVAAAQASVAASAQRQLVGEAAAVQDRLRQRLRQVARTMPDIDLPDQADGDLPSTAANPAAEPAGPAAGAPFEGESAAHVAALSDNAPDAPSGQPAVRPPEVAPAMITPAAAPPAQARSELPGGTGTIAPLQARPDANRAAPPAPQPSELRDGARAMALLHVQPDALADQTQPRRMPTWLRNAVATVADHRPAIAVVIDDLGLNRRGTAALNRLRAPLTLAFLPYAADLDAQTKAAHAAGHELMVHMPMEPRGGDWPGPNALTTQLGPAELVSRLRSQLRSFDGFVGINNHMGSLLTADAARMDIVMAELGQRGLLFLDSRTAPDSVAAREAARMHVPFAERDVFIDNDLDLRSVLRELAHAESIARHKGYAVAMGHPHDVTIEALKRWLASLDARGIALVPISAIVARQSCEGGLILVGNACARYAVAATVVQ